MVQVWEGRRREGVRGEPYAGGLQLCGERRFGYMVVVGWCG